LDERSVHWSVQALLPDQITPLCPAETDSLIGLGALDALPQHLDTLGAERVLIVRDRVAAQTSGANERLAHLLRDRICLIEEGFGRLPTDADALRVAGAARALGADAIVALGGGVVIDIAKVAAVLAGTERGLPSLLSTQLLPDDRALPLIAIPTTAGTGAECTSSAVIYVEARKHSLEAAQVRPRFALVDPGLCHSLPPEQTAATGLDALCQAIESLWAIGSTEDSRRDSLRALKLAAMHLERAVHSPDEAARHGMSESAHFAGRAIDVTRTTAPHALSYRLTERFALHHGFAVALFTPPVIRRLADLSDHDCLDPRGPAFVQDQVLEVAARLGAESARGVADAIEALMEACGAPTRLSQVGIVAMDDLADLVAHVNARRLANHPQRLHAAALEEIVTSIA
jgi:alcohol dehydrogenase class IV